MTESRCGNCHSANLLVIAPQARWCSNCGIVYNGRTHHVPAQQHALQALYDKTGKRVQLDQACRWLINVWEFLDDSNLLPQYFDRRGADPLQSPKSSS
jgi:hypothetical protein